MRLARRQCRRRMFSVLAVVVAVGLVAGLLDAVGGSPPSRAHHGPAAASPGEVAAFVSRAEKGFSGRFALRYAVSYAGSPQAVQGTVASVQQSRTRWAYTSTPSAQDIHARGSASAVFVDPRGEPAGRYSCDRARASASWRCAAFTTAGMGTDAALLGPYPPTALILGLRNAIVEYSGKITGHPIAPQPAHLVARGAGTTRVSCLAFGMSTRPVALVCLDSANLITSYDIPGEVSSIAYTRALLRSRSLHVPHSALVLPTRPATAVPVPGAPPCADSQVGSRVRPEEISIGCTADAAYLKHITWQRWTGGTLYGMAELYTRNADGTITSAQAKVGLSEPGDFEGHVVFRSLSFTTATGPPRTLTNPGERWGWVTPGR